MRKNIKVPKIPQYFYVMDDVVKKIRDGEYRPGTKIESVRDLSKKYNMVRGVVLYALNMLACKSYLYSEPKRGFFVNPNIKPHRSYTIGYFINNYDLMCAGNSIAVVRDAMLAHGYRAVLGFNYYDGSTIDDFLEKNKLLDGLIIDGVLEEKDLKNISARHIPYIIVGNHNISSEHPQEIVDPEEDLYKQLIDVFRPFKGKKIGAITGDIHYPDDSAAMRAIHRAVKDSGAKYMPELLVSTVMSDGFPQCRELIENHSPDVLFLMQMGGYRKYMNIFKPVKRPYVIYTCPVFQPGDEKIFDYYMELSDKSRPLIRHAVERLFTMIDENVEKRNPVFLQDIVNIKTSSE